MSSSRSDGRHDGSTAANYGAGSGDANNSGISMIYVLLDGVGDLPHADLGGRTPLEAASTPALDAIASNGASGRVISVGKGIAPESDIAVFNMLGYKFSHADYAGRGVIEAIGIGIDFADGDLALRGNFATLDRSGGDNVITDRRAGRHIEPADSEAISREIEESVGFSDPRTSVKVSPTIGHRVTVRLRRGGGRPYSAKISNTDPAYTNIGGMGVAKAVADFMKVERCVPLDGSGEAAAAADATNEFSEQAISIMGGSRINAARVAAGKKELSCILLRDAGSKYPRVEPINQRYGMNFSCIVDMPVEIGISKVLRMKAFEAGGLTDYEEKARVASEAMETQNAIYVHIKGPDEFGHDGDAVGKKENIEEIDRRFFARLLDGIDTSRTAVVISADHSTPCINHGHSDDPVPVVISHDGIPGDGTTRMTESQAARGRIGMLAGADVIPTALGMLRRIAQGKGTRLD